MGRQPQPKSEKETRGTFRPERDRTVTISSEQETPEPPDSLDAIGLHFWELAYQQLDCHGVFGQWALLK